MQRQLEELETCRINTEKISVTEDDTYLLEKKDEDWMVKRECINFQVRIFLQLKLKNSFRNIFLYFRIKYEI